MDIINLSKCNDICQSSDKLLITTQKAYKILSNSGSLADKKRWLKLIDKSVRICNKAIIDKKELTTSHCRKLITNVGHFKRIRLMIKDTINNSKKCNRKPLRWVNLQSAFHSRIRTGLIVNTFHKDVLKFFKEAFVVLKSNINKIFKTFSIIKVNTTFCGSFIKKTNSGDSEVSEFKYFNTPNAVIDLSSDLQEWFQENVVDKILNKLEEFQERDSGFSLEKIVSLEININKYEIGNPPSAYFPLPREITLKKACVNVKNHSNEACFYISVVSALYPAKKNVDHLSSYPNYETVLNLTGLDIPIDFKQIKTFEVLNDISINVFGLELDQHSKFITVPIRLSQYKNDQRKHVNLLMFQNYYPSKKENDANVEIKYHFCYIKNLSRLISSQLSKNKHSKWICDRCLNYFSDSYRLRQHERVCCKLNNAKVSFSNEKFISFKNVVHQQEVPFIIYSDFETMLKPFTDNKKCTNSTRYQHHVPFSVGYYLVCNYDSSLNVYKSYRGLDCVDWFLNELDSLGRFVKEKFDTILPMDPVPIDADRTKCHICQKLFTKDDVVCRDHIHFKSNVGGSNFRGFAHRSCNSLLRKKLIVPIIFHNLNFDSHLFIKELAKRSPVSLLPKNKENYISFTKYDKNNNLKFRFVDSFRFLNYSLAKLVDLLKKDEFVYTKREFNNLNDEEFNLLTRKGVVPYEYIDSIEKLDETALPDAKAFYNKLKDEDVDPKDYQHAHRMWKDFNIQTLGQFFDLYMKCDILQLADVFENFRKICFKTHGLDAAFYSTLPSFSWDCMMKYTGVILETIQDVDMLMFLENSVRGGIVQCCNRYSRANNKYMPDFDVQETSKYINYFDINSLYGTAMGGVLPYGGLEWVEEENVENFNVKDMDDESEFGFFLEVDLSYPEKLHNLHRDLPFCAEKLVPPGSKLEKLMTTLHDKNNYIIHYRALKQCLEAGLELRKIHRILKFKQSNWLQPYIDLNAKLRAASDTEFGKQLYKLLVNAIYGKFLQNVRKHRIIKLVRKWEGICGLKNLIASPNFHSRTIFDENLAAVELKKTNIVFDKPLYVGVAILDLSKIILYDFHYNFMLKQMPLENCKLLYTDTDSLIYELICEDAYRDIIKANSHKFDTSGYKADNPFGIQRLNKKIPGLMEDVTEGRIITHFVGLRSKQYTFIIENEKCIKRAKGIKTNVVDRKITFNDYLNCLRNNVENIQTQRLLKSELHEMYSVEQTKIALSPFDDKRHIINNSTDTLPWGHFGIIE